MSYFMDKFFDNRNGWGIRDDADSMFSINRGRAFFEHRRNFGWYAVCVPIRQLECGQYSLATDIKCITIPDDGWFGFVWGLRDIDNFFTVTISANGFYYAIHQMMASNWVSIVSWLRLPFQIDVRNDNRVGVVQDNEQCKLFIHDQIVYDFKMTNPLPGNKVGYIAGPTMKMSISGLFVKEYFDLIKDKRLSPLTVRRSNKNHKRTPASRTEMSEYIFDDEEDVGGLDDTLPDEYGLLPLDTGDYFNIITRETMDPGEAQEYRRLSDYEDGIVDDD